MWCSAVCIQRRAEARFVRPCGGCAGPFSRPRPGPRTCCSKSLPFPPPPGRLACGCRLRGGARRSAPRIPSPERSSSCGRWTSWSPGKVGAAQRSVTQRSNAPQARTSQPHNATAHRTHHASHPRPHPHPPAHPLHAEEEEENEGIAGLLLGGGGKRERRVKLRERVEEILQQDREEAWQAEEEGQQQQG